MKDPVFGKMEYDFQWQKDETIELWGKSYSVQIVAQSEDDDDTEISQVQRDAYVFFKSNFASLAESGMESILNYCVEDLGISNCTKVDFLANSKPTTIFFALSAAFRALCRLLDVSRFVLYFSPDAAYFALTARLTVIVSIFFVVLFNDLLEH